jgi:hypothetical protein
VVLGEGGVQLRLHGGSLLPGVVGIAEATAHKQ